MFKKSDARFIILFLVFFLYQAAAVFSQDLTAEVNALRERGIASYEEGDFAEAANNMLKVVRQAPADAMARYYAGVSLVKLDRDLEEAAELLYFASTRGAPKDVYYYLGEAYRKLYDFKRARQFYSRFDEEAPRSVTRDLHSRQLVSSAIAAIDLTSTYNPFDVKNVTFIDLNDPSQAGQISMRGGKLEPKPEALFTVGEDKDGLNRMMFMPRNINPGNIIYYSALSAGGKQGFQLMRARVGNTGKWTNIEEVDALNTEQDEILPYFDPVSEDIYFASNGRDGLGGFDLFRSHYDADNDQWSEPVNLGFPVNSVYDDYLALPGTDLGMLIFFTARVSTDTTIAAYRVHLREPKESLLNKSPEDLRKIANLGFVASDMLTEIEDESTEIAVSTVKEEKPELVVAEAETAIETSPAPPAGSYQAILANALRHQATSDSLTELATSARAEVRNSEDPNDRWLYQQQIMVWEKKASEERAKADAYFSQLPEKNPDDVPPTIEVDTVINDITVYRYTGSDSVSEMAKAAFSKEEEAPGEIEKAPAATTTTVSNDGKNEFSLLPESPYSIDNPIPSDIQLPDGVFYRIQLGVFSDKVDPQSFNGITPISSEPLTGRGLIRYYAGSFINYDAAEDALPEVRASGFRDAFIVAWYNGSKMSVDKAKQLEIK